MPDPKDALRAKLALWLKFRPKATLAIAASAELGTRTKEPLFGIDEPIAKGDAPQTRLLLKAMKNLVPEVEKDLGALTALAAELEAFTQEDPAFATALEDFKTLTADIAEARRKAATRPMALTATIRKAEQALAKMGDTQTDLIAEWARIDQLARDADLSADQDAARLSVAMNLAAIAVATRDAAGLASAKNSAGGTLGGIGRMLANFPKSLHQQADDFAKRLSKVRLDKGQMAELARQKDATQKLVAKVESKRKSNAKLRSQIMAMQIEPPDLKKAAKALGIAVAQALPLLEKALAADPTGMGKMLEAALKAAGVDMTGRAALDKLKKAKVL